MADLFQGLFEFQWRGLSAPCRSFRTSGGQDLAEHKRVDRDGGRQEATGRNPYVFEVDLVFINGLAPGPSETWGSGLFPERFQQFLGMLEDRTSGNLQHPIFGNINCKAATWDFAVNADERGGVFCKVVFKQSDDGDDAVALGSLHAFTAAQVAAGNLDAALGQLSPPPDPTWGLDDGTSFGDGVNNIASIGDSVSLSGAQIVGQITNIQAKCDTISDAFSNASPVLSSTQNLTTNTGVSFAVRDNGGLGRTVTGDDGTTRPLGAAGSRIVDSCTQLRAALALLVDQLLVADKAIAFYTTQRAMTLGALAVPLKTSVPDLIILNRPLVAQPIVPRGTVLRYYA